MFYNYFVGDDVDIVPYNTHQFHLIDKPQFTVSISKDS